MLPRFFEFHLQSCCICDFYEISNSIQFSSIQYENESVSTIFIVVSSSFSFYSIYIIFYIFNFTRNLRIMMLNKLSQCLSFVGFIFFSNSIFLVCFALCSFSIILQLKYSKRFRSFITTLNSMDNWKMKRECTTTNNITTKLTHSLTQNEYEPTRAHPSHNFFSLSMLLM